MKYLTNLIIGLSLVGILVWNPSPLQILELKTFDWLMAGQEPVQDNMILLVDLDEENSRGLRWLSFTKKFIRNTN